MKIIIKGVCGEIGQGGGGVSTPPPKNFFFNLRLDLHLEQFKCKVFSIFNSPMIKKTEGSGSAASPII